MPKKLKCWRKTINQKDSLWWQVGINKENPKYLPEKWITIQEQTPYIKKEFGYSWQVRTPTRINSKTIYGKSKFFKTKSSALKFAHSYMRKHNTC